MEMGFDAAFFPPWILLIHAKRASFRQMNWEPACGTPLLAIHIADCKGVAIWICPNDLRGTMALELLHDSGHHFLYRHLIFLLRRQVWSRPWFCFFRRMMTRIFLCLIFYIRAAEKPNEDSGKNSDNSL